MYYYYNKDKEELIDASNKLYGDSLMQLTKCEYETFQLLNRYSESEVYIALEKVRNLIKEDKNAK